MTRQSGPFRELVDQFLKHAHADLTDRPETGQLASEFVAWLRALAEAGEALPRAALERMEQEGAERWIKEGIARRVPMVDPATGRVFAGRTRAGVPARDEHGARVGGWQQVLFRKLTRAEFREWVAMQRRNRDALTAYIALGDRILRAWGDHPEALTVEEVCAQAGIELPPELLSETIA